MNNKSCKNTKKLTGGKGRMLSMYEIEDIRIMYFNKRMKVSEICKLTGFDRKTVSKYLKIENFNK
jgi:DNA-binding transcriptional regulator LsrR (DeoR family)